MKRLHANFQRSKPIISIGLFAVVAGIFLSLATPVYAGQAMGPPPWYPFEKDAINLYLSGTSQESSNPDGALKTLLQAQQESRAAIRNGGGGNEAVLHNDWLIGRAVAIAQADAAKASANREAPVTQRSNGNNQVKSSGSHIQTARQMTTQQLVHVSRN